MSTITFSIPNISCKHCAHAIKSELGEVSGVKSVDVAVEKKEASITFEAPATEALLKQTLKDIGYQPVD